jgi:cytoskeletal protein RodZ
MTNGDLLTSRLRLLFALIGLLFVGGLVGLAVNASRDSGNETASPSSTTSSSSSSSSSPGGGVTSTQPPSSTSLSTVTTLAGEVTSTTAGAGASAGSTGSTGTTDTTSPPSGLSSSGSGAVADGRPPIANTGGQPLALPGLVALTLLLSTRLLARRQTAQQD